MLFSSLEFLYLFLPLTLLCYFISPKGAKNYVLLLSSLVFYGIAKPKFLPLMLAVCLWNYAFGAWVEKAVINGQLHKANGITALAVAINAVTLFSFKYLDTTLTALGLTPIGTELPVGISFYIFQATSYVIDLRRRTAACQKNPLLFVTYVSLFPQLVAGPIVRYCEIDGQLTCRRHSTDRTADGLRLFCVGLAKKVLLANGAGECWERMAGYSKSCPSALGAWLGIAFFAFQIYFDFSGYSDMARGLGRIFGFDFPENFRYPYTCKSITDFWRRWHITLSSWFREYVYIPLGGNRRGMVRTYVNLLVTWLLTGVWHGASINFLLWGLYFFVVLAVEKAFLGKVIARLPAVAAHGYSILLILIGWLIFASDGNTLSLYEGVRYLGYMLCVDAPLFSNDALAELLRNSLFLGIMAVASTPLPSKAFDQFKRKSPSAAAFASTVLAIASLILSSAYLASSSYNPFLYFQF